jgi:formylglycine-generating enzyme required for sulfatase activity
MMKFQRFMILATLIGLAACGYQTPTETPHPTENDQTPLVISSPTSTPVTPEPTVTEIPTATLKPTITFTPTPLLPSFTDEFGNEMILIPAGTFEMGSELGNEDEIPVHMVYLDNFYIDKYEVTNEQYAFFLTYMGNQEEDGEFWYDAFDFDSRIHPGGDKWTVETGFENFPVINVTWYGAQAYCQFRAHGGRLPTEAEWEKAARGVEGFIYPWGDLWLDNFANASEGDRYSQLGPVGRFPGGASPYGILDMAGNVQEWVADWYASDYYQNSPAENPMGPDPGKPARRVLRGGSWNYYPYIPTNAFRTTNRESYAPTVSGWDIGFRCVLPIP